MTCSMCLVVRVPNQHFELTRHRLRQERASVCAAQMQSR